MIGCKEKDAEIPATTCKCPEYIEYQSYLPPDDSGDYYINPTDTIQLFAPNQTATSYSWSPTAYVSCIDCPNTFADPHVTTQFIVSYGTGQSTEDTITVVVRHAESVNIPNIFSPDRNYFNDQFRVLTWEPGLVEDFELKINRGSQLVFQTNDLFAGWNGRVDGNVYNCETYNYEVAITFNSGNKLTYNGEVLLFVNDGVSCPDNPAECAFEAQFDYLRFRSDYTPYGELEGC